MRLAALVLLLCCAVGSVAAQAPAGPRFDVLEFEVEGNTALPAAAIEAAVYPFLGESRTLDDVESARAALERAYREAGFVTVLVNIPEQRVDGGLVRLEVIEGRVARTRVTGARYYSQGRILAGAPSLTEGSVPNALDIQDDLAEINRSADRRVTPTFRPGRQPGTTEVDLAVEDALPLHGRLELNNRYSPDTEPLRLLGTLRYDNFFQRGHSGSVQYQTSPQDTSQVWVLSGAYTMPLAQRRFLTAYAIQSDSAIATGVAGASVIGQGSIYGLRYTMALRGSERLNHSATLGVDRKNSDQDAAGVFTPVSYTPFTAAYSGALADDTGITEFGAGLNVSFRGLGNEESEFENRRFNASANYLYLRFDLSRTQKLPAGLSLYGRLDGQVANGPLINNEQFVAGGIDSVRGYLEASALGDNGFRGSLELRSPQWATLAGDAMNDLRGVVFVDGARLTVRDPLPQEEDRFTLASTGLGLRMRAFDRLQLRVDAGYALREQGTTDRRELRVQFVSAYEF
jgi:hemolysin activation/secretion protein